MNERGISFIETVIGMAILSIIALTLIPIAQQLQTNIYAKQLAVHASEVALNGAKMMKTYGQTAGVMTIDHVSYDWLYDGHTICVSYTGLDGTVRTCIDM